VFGIARHVYASHCEAYSQHQDRLLRRLAGRRDLDQDQVGELLERTDAERAGRDLIARLAALPERDQWQTRVWCELRALSPAQRGAGEGREPPSVRMNRPADMGAAGQCGRLAGTGLAVTLGQGNCPGSSGPSPE
jgi:RNA polymerase sigma-70 factor (ECF subfamily)